MNLELNQKNSGQMRGARLLGIPLFDTLLQTLEKKVEDVQIAQI